MAIYNFTIPNFHITQIRSAHKDTLYASAGLRVMDAIGGLHNDLAPQGASLGDHGAGDEVGLNLSFKNVDVPDPTPDNPDGGAVYWTFLLVNQGNADITAAGFVAVINKAVDAFAGALADKVGEGAAVTVASLYGLAAILGIQELVNLITADCDGTVAVGDIELTAANLAGLVPITGQVWTQNQNNPGTNSPAGCGRNSDYVVTYQIQNLTPGVWHTDDITASTGAPAAAGDRTATCSTPRDPSTSSTAARTATSTSCTGWPTRGTPMTSPPRPAPPPQPATRTATCSTPRDPSTSSTAARTATSTSCTGWPTRGTPMTSPPRPAPPPQPATERLHVRRPGIPARRLPQPGRPHPRAVLAGRRVAHR